MNTNVVGYLPLTVTLDVSDIPLDYGGRVIMSVFTFIICISIPLNAAIIAACFYRRLHSPMLLYIALSSLADTLWGVVGISSYFSRIIARREIISFNECLFQLFSIHCTLFQQFLTTWLMYVDRHWAIFWPYSYVALMVNKGGTVKLVIVVLTIGLLLSVSYVVVPTTMVYCNYSVVVRDVICASSPVARSACGNVNPSLIHSLFFQYLVYGLTGFTALYSTWCIVRKCSKSSTEANIKALHTCFTQLFASLAQFIILFLINVMKRFVRLPTFGFILDLLSAVTPVFVNPLIFGPGHSTLDMLLLLSHQWLVVVKQRHPSPSTYCMLLTRSVTLPCSPNSLLMVSRSISTHGSQTSSPVAVNVWP
uniref:G-protein coupled receptors family 1 profile domain-containing protein n=1 Tax=Eptatretus burgeri TaxID=7764 RepID=A0A8C4Q2J0_EPTBU